MITVILFMVISVSIVAVIAPPVLKHIRISRNFIESRQSFFNAEAGTEDVTFRLKNNLQVNGNDPNFGHSKISSIKVCIYMWMRV